MAASAQGPRLELAPPLSDHVVLQRGTAIVVRGRAGPGAAVAVRLGDEHASVQADAGGRWRAELPPRAAGGPWQLVVESEGERVTCDDVLAGEVWLCSGQSNMEWPVRAARDAERELATADLPRLRLLEVPRTAAEAPASEIAASWARCSPETVAEFSAVGFFFGRELHERLGVPVGLIDATWGGTSAEAWISGEGLERAGLDEIPARWAARVDEHRAARREWSDRAARARAAGAEPPPEPRPPAPQRAPAALWNGMVAPLAGTPIAGVIWYQGEADTSRARRYRRLFPALIEDWRRAWGRDDLAFLFVQLASFGGGNDAAWAELREAQHGALSLPRTGMAVTTDIGDRDDIHPRNKQDVAARLARHARRIVYGETELVASGPVLRGVVGDGARLRLHFDHVGGGLVARGGGALRGFELAGPGGDYVPAQARVDGDTVVVWSPDVPAPMDVRYAWSAAPLEANLANTEGLPAAPFRTDDRPATTRDAR